jgi:hypothetical protein
MANPLTIFKGLLPKKEKPLEPKKPEVKGELDKGVTAIKTNKRKITEDLMKEQ